MIDTIILKTAKALSILNSELYSKTLNVLAQDIGMGIFTGQNQDIWCEKE